jgi:hypothetical protein
MEPHFLQHFELVVALVLNSQVMHLVLQRSLIILRPHLLAKHLHLPGHLVVSKVHELRICALLSVEVTVSVHARLSCLAWGHLSL